MPHTDGPGGPWSLDEREPFMYQKAEITQGTLALGIPTQANQV